MHVGASRNNNVVENLNLLCDLELILGLHAILLLLDYVHTLMKLAQSRDVVVYDFIDVVKVCQLDLYRFYFDPYTKFDDPIFDEPKALESFISKNLPMKWCEDLNGKEADYFIIEIVGTKFYVNKCCQV
jgi:hypothetical protein